MRMCLSYATKVLDTGEQWDRFVVLVAAFVGTEHFGFL